MTTTAEVLYHLVRIHLHPCPSPKPESVLGPLQGVVLGEVTVGDYTFLRIVETGKSSTLDIPTSIIRKVEVVL
jgi:hypothetical protein